MEQQTSNIQNNTQDTIDIMAVVRRCLKYWYWFLISGFICCLAAVMYVLCTTKQWHVSSSMMMKDKSPMGAMASMAANNEMLSMIGLGGSSDVADELYILGTTTCKQSIARKTVCAGKDNILNVTSTCTSPNCLLIQCKEPCMWIWSGQKMLIA